MFFKALLIILAVTTTKPLITIDRIAATVNSEVITQSDIDKAVLLYPHLRNPGESVTSYYKRVLQELINYKVLALEYGGTKKFTEEDYADLQTSIISRMGSMENVLKSLKKYDMNWDSLKLFIRDKMIHDQIVADKLQIRISIDLQEVENYYNNIYVPSQKALRLEPKSFIEIANTIEKHLRSGRTKLRIKEWLDEIKKSYKIINLFEKENK